MSKNSTILLSIIIESFSTSQLCNYHDKNITINWKLVKVFLSFICQIILIASDNLQKKYFFAVSSQQLLQNYSIHVNCSER